ncbi:MAG: diguanylate cyclase [Pseudomonadota bacterium]
MNKQYSILLLSNEEADLVVVDYILHGSLMPGCTVKRASSPAEAERLLAMGQYDLCLVDAGEGNHRGYEFAAQQRRRDPTLPIVLLTDREDQSIDREVEACGAADYLPKGKFHASRLARTVRQAIERQALISRIRRLEQYDELTGLAKRQNILRRLSQMLALGRRNKFSGALVLFRLLDLDEITQSLGPAMVDFVLVRMAGRLSETVRQADLIGRWDDTTFAVVAGNIANQDAADTLVAKVCGAFEAPLRLEDTDLLTNVTSSAVLWPGGGDDVDALAGKAEASLARPPGDAAQAG